MPFFCVLLSVYFFHHSLSGRYGWEAQQVMQEKAIQLDYRLAGLRIKRDQLQTRVLLLKNGSIERDMLDEQARYHLNLLGTDEIAIMR